MVKSDVAFLKSCGLMDYSLIVGCLTEKISPGMMPSQPSMRYFMFAGCTLGIQKNCVLERCRRA